VLPSGEKATWRGGGNLEEKGGGGNFPNPCKNPKQLSPTQAPLDSNYWSNTPYPSLPKGVLLWEGEDSFPFTPVPFGVRGGRRRGEG